MRICHLGKFYPPASGGIENHVRSLAHAQAGLGAEVQVVCVNHDRGGADVSGQTLAQTLTRTEQDGPVFVTRVGRRASIAKLDVCPALPRLAAMVSSGRFDIVHLHVPNPTMLLALVAFPPKARLVITHHSDIVRQRLLGAAFRPFERLVYGRAARIISDSPQYIEASSVLRAYLPRVVTIPVGLDLARFLEPSPAARRYADELRRLHNPIWLTVGRLVYYKGLNNAIEALRRVPGTLLVIGEGPLHRQLEQQAVDLGVADRVRFLGRVGSDELAGAYLAATALWFPSNARSEGFGLVQVEAMAAGCPVINADIPGSGVSWVSRHGESGFTVPVDDPASLAAASRRLLDDPALRKRLGEGGRQRAKSEFSDVLMARRTIDLYRDCMES